MYIIKQNIEWRKSYLEYSLKVSQYSGERFRTPVPSCSCHPLEGWHLQLTKFVTYMLATVKWSSIRKLSHGVISRDSVEVGVSLKRSPLSFKACADLEGGRGSDPPGK